MYLKAIEAGTYKKRGRSKKQRQAKTGKDSKDGKDQKQRWQRPIQFGKDRQR